MHLLGEWWFGLPVILLVVGGLLTWVVSYSAKCHHVSFWEQLLGDK